MALKRLAPVLGLCVCLSLGLLGCLTDFGAVQRGDGAVDGQVGSCGDGVLEGAEQCDDGNTEDGDGCDVECRVESGWRCAGEPSLCEETCGDGLQDPGEDCDGADLGGQSCASLGKGYAVGTLLCTDECRFDESWCVPPFCGDGILDPDEECDQGSFNSDTLPDACRTSCRLPWCGDGVIDAEEECDQGAANSDVLPDACRADCLAAHCGDGVTDTGEECDHGAANSDVSPGACRTDCRAAHCGDGVTDTGEECDHGAANSDVLPDACRADCHAAHCGDGVIDAGEECDDGLLNSDTNPNACRTDCTRADPTWPYTHWRVDQPVDGCGEWGKITEVWFMVAGTWITNGATGYTSGTAGGQSIVAITHSGDSASYGRAWSAFDGGGDAWQKYSGGSYYWVGGEYLILQVSAPIVAKAVRVGGFWGSTTCVRLSGSVDGSTWEVLGTLCNGDCTSIITFLP